MRRKSWIVGGLALAAALATWGVAEAWWVKGHGTITEAAAIALPDDVPAFFRSAGKSLNHLRRRPGPLEEPRRRPSSSAVYPEHFIDWEDLEGNEPPPKRYDFIALAQKLKKAPDKVGTLPWAIMEGYDKLMLAFRDYRHDKDNPVHPDEVHRLRRQPGPFHDRLLRCRCTRPATTTAAGTDGKRSSGASTPSSTDSRRRSASRPRRSPAACRRRSVDDVWGYVLKFIKESRSHIDKAYELDAAGGFTTPTDASRAFVMARCRAGAQFTMDLWYTAWVKSAKLSASSY